jgi:hypothetical protein
LEHHQVSLAWQRHTQVVVVVEIAPMVQAQVVQAVQVVGAMAVRGRMVSLEQRTRAEEEEVVVGLLTNKFCTMAEQEVLA